MRIIIQNWGSQEKIFDDLDNYQELKSKDIIKNTDIVKQHGLENIFAFSKTTVGKTYNNLSHIVSIYRKKSKIIKKII
jgi:hypothetical protein